MSAKLLNGTQLAREKKDLFKKKIDAFTAAGQRPPSLAVILVGSDPASMIYVQHKEKACTSVGIRSSTFRLPDTTSIGELKECISKLNADPSIDAILLQLPLPKHLNRHEAISFINPKKDVDGLTEFNQGALVWGNPRAIVPCTPLGIMELLQTIPDLNLRGKIAAVLGRSVLVGSPIGTLLEQKGATLISMHSGTKNPETLSKQADIVVVATGVKSLLKGSWVKDGAIVIDVGIHRDSGKIVGDCDFEALSKKTSYITPVPGGVGPMTIAMLMSNCIRCYEGFASHRS